MTDRLTDRKLPTFRVKQLTDMPEIARGRGSKYQVVFDTLRKEGQTGWGILVDGEPGCSDKDLLTMTSSMRTAARIRGLNTGTRTDFKERGVWIWFLDHAND